MYEVNRQIMFMDNDKTAMAQIKTILEAPAVFYNLLNKAIERYGKNSVSNLKWLVLLPEKHPDDPLGRVGYISWHIED